MRFEVTGRGPLKGRVRPPGDEALTLGAVAFSFAAGGRGLRIVNPAPSPAAERLLSLYGASGGGVERGDDGWKLTGGPAGMTGALDDSVPDDALHILVAGLVFSGKNAVVGPSGPRRGMILQRLARLLETLGKGSTMEMDDDGAATFPAADFHPPSIVTVRSAWELEVVCAGAMAAEKAVSVSYPAQAATHVLKTVSAFGMAAADGSVEDAGREAELARRLSRSLGETPPAIRTFTPSGERASEIVIPGDTAIAAAVVCAAALIPKSKTTVENVLWEQGRRGVFEILRRMKADIDVSPRRGPGPFESADVTVGWSEPVNVHVTADQARTCRNELLVLGAFSAYVSGETVLSDCTDEPGVGRYAFAALSRGLEMMGAHVGDYADGFVVRGGRELRGDLVDSDGHAGAALALALAGMNAGGETTVFGVDPEEHPIKHFLAMIDSLEKR